LHSGILHVIQERQKAGNHLQNIRFALKFFQIIKLKLEFAKSVLLETFILKPHRKNRKILSLPKKASVKEKFV